MTNIQILKKAINKAKKNGWITKVIEINEGYENIVIFDRDFAKAIAGKEMVDLPETGGEMSAWEVYLIQMVLAEDRIKCIKQYL